MKNKISFISLLHLIILLTGCSKSSQDQELAVYNNTSKPQNPEFSIEIIRQDTLQNTDELSVFETPWDLVEDGYGNIFITSIGNCKIIKFDRSLSFIKEFGGAGEGPGEFTTAESLIVHKDTLLVADMMTKKINRFDLDGNFIGSFLDPVISQSHSMSGPVNNTYLSQSISIPDIEEGSASGIAKLTLLDSDFKKVRDIYNAGEVDNAIFIFSRICYAAAKDFIYVAENRTDRYRILFYNYDGNQKGVINKSYAVVRFSPENEGLSKAFKSPNKRSITNLYLDYEENLWVMKAQPDGKTSKHYIVDFKFDVFKNGMFINEISFENIAYDPYEYPIKTKVIGNRIYSIYTFEHKVIVSEYKINPNRSSL
jgi:hypothetical protein